MCDFKVGDEVVIVRSDHGREGMVCTVLAVCRAGETPPVLRGVLKGRVLAPQIEATIQVEEVEWNEGLQDGGYLWGYNADCFRKIQRRDLKAWLATAVKVPALDKRKVNA